MAASGIAIYGAIAANAAIAVTRFTVKALPGSSAMLSEGIHSAVDTGNGCLLLVGLSRSQKPATADHPLGHGKELCFWSLIVAVLSFGLGGGIYASHALDMPEFDGVASICIGLVLAGVAVLLIIESRSLLVGERGAAQAYLSRGACRARLRLRHAASSWPCPRWAITRDWYRAAFARAVRGLGKPHRCPAMNRAKQSAAVLRK